MSLRRKQRKWRNLKRKQYARMCYYRDLLECLAAKLNCPVGQVFNKVVALQDSITNLTHQSGASIPET